MNEDDNSEFKKSASPPVYTNSSQTNYTLTGLQPYTVYNFQVGAEIDSLCMYTYLDVFWVFNMVEIF